MELWLYQICWFKQPRCDSVWWRHFYLDQQMVFTATIVRTQIHCDISNSRSIAVLCASKIQEDILTIGKTKQHHLNFTHWTTVHSLCLVSQYKREQRTTFERETGYIVYSVISKQMFLFGKNSTCDNVIWWLSHTLKKFSSWTECSVEFLLFIDDMILLLRNRARISVQAVWGKHRSLRMLQ